MKVLFLNNSPLLTHGLASGFAPTDEIRFLPVLEQNWQQSFPLLVRSWRPDFALAEGVSISTVARELFKLLAIHNLPLVYWAIDDPPDFERMSLPLSRRAALVLTPAQECLPKYRKQGIKAKYFHFACNPAFHRQRTPSPEYAADLTLVANYYTSYPQRKAGLEIILKPLLHSENLKVYGNEHWQANTDGFHLPGDIYQGYLPYHQLPVAYASAKIALGLHSVIDSPTMMSMRTFEALGCGVFFLTHWSTALENIFKNHVHLVWSRHPDETVELVRFYLARPDLRSKIARQGQEEAYRHHTYKERVEIIRTALSSIR